MAFWDFLFNVNAAASTIKKQVEPYRALSKAEIFQTIAAVLKEQKLPAALAPMIYAHGQVESGHSSKVFKADWNAYGLKVSSKRPTTSIGKGSAAPAGESSIKNDPNNYYNKFANFGDSVRDLILRQNYFNFDWIKASTVQGYVSECIRTKYFQASSTAYLNLFNQIYAGVKNYKWPASGNVSGTIYG